MLRINTGLVVEVEIASSIEVNCIKQIEMGLMMKPDFFEGFDRMAKAQITLKIIDDGSGFGFGLSSLLGVANVARLIVLALSNF